MRILDTLPLCWTVWSSFVVSIFVVAFSATAQDQASIAAPAPEPPVARFETTKLGIELNPQVLLFTQPVREDGTIDCIAALNKKYSAGVTADDNAFRALFLCFKQQVNEGNGFDDAGHIAATKKTLGIGADELAGPHVFSWFDDARRRGLDDDSAWRLYEKYWDGPYAEPEAKPFVSWLESMRPALSRAYDALDRQNYWMPLLAGKEARTKSVVLFPHLGHHRQLARVLQARAFYAAFNGERDETIRAIRGLCRLAELQSKEPTVLSLLVARGIAATAEGTILFLIQEQALPASTLAEIDRLLRARPQSLPVTPEIVAVEWALALESYMAILAGRAKADDMLGVAGEFIG